MVGELWSRQQMLYPPCSHLLTAIMCCNVPPHNTIVSKALCSSLTLATMKFRPSPKHIVLHLLVVRFLGLESKRSLYIKFRSIDRKSGYEDAERSNRPSPVTIRSLRLFITYGADVTVAEAETQVIVYKRLQGQVPAPEVFDPALQVEWHT